MSLDVPPALAEAGVGVPDKVSVVGFDDQPEAAYFAPPVTTVPQDFDEVGLLALKLLLDQIADRSTDKRHLVEPRLVVRQSTAPYPVNEVQDPRYGRCEGEQQRACLAAYLPSFGPAAAPSRDRQRGHADIYHHHWAFSFRLNAAQAGQSWGRWSRW